MLGTLLCLGVPAGVGGREKGRLREAWHTVGEVRGW